MAIYRMIDFFIAEEMMLHPAIEERAVKPFTDVNARRFFPIFEKESFTFDGVVKFILIYDGKDDLPRSGYASGYLFSQNYDEFQEFLKRFGEFPKPVGNIFFSFRENVPNIKVTAFSGDI